MNTPDSPSGSDMLETMKKRLLQNIRIRMEGTLNRESPSDLQMFDELFGELLEDENIVLSRAERQALYDELLASF